MTALHAKLNSSRGMSMLMAILLLLVATMVSVVILSAATTGMKRAESDRAGQQAYLTVSSAAQLLRDEISDQSYTSTVTTYYLDEAHTQQDGDANSVITEAGGAFGPLLNAALGTGSLVGYTNTFYMEVDGMEQVKVLFAMDTVPGPEGTITYNITAELTLADGTAQHNCRMFLSLKGTVTETVNAGRLDSTPVRYFAERTTVIRWGDPVISKEVSP